jgi:hypothetical protein
VAALAHPALQSGALRPAVRFADHFRSLTAFAHDLMAKGEPMHYRRDLSWLFVN